MHVLIATKKYPPEIGGTEVYGEHIAKAYARRGITPVIVTSFPGRLGLHERDYSGVKAQLYNVGRGSQPVTFLRMIWVIRRIARTQAFAFCHATTWRGGLSLLCANVKGRKALTVHGREVLINPLFLKPALRMTIRRFDVIIAVSKFTLDALIAAEGGPRGSARWTVSFNGISYEQEARAYPGTLIDTAPVRIYSFCRLVERKNIVRALKALKLVKDRGQEGFEYIIAGAGPMLAEIEVLVKGLGLADKVKLLGRIPEEELTLRFRLADIFLHPQISLRDGKDVEGFGLVIADAMSFGALAVAGVDGGPSDFIINEETGFLVDGTDVGAIASTLSRVIADADLRRRVANAGRKWVLSNLSWDRHVSDVINSLNS